MKVQFDKLTHISQRGFHIKPGEVKYAYKCKGFNESYILCHGKSRQTCFATVHKSCIFSNAHKVMA